MKYFAQYRQDVYDGRFRGEPASIYIPRVFDFETFDAAFNAAKELMLSLNDQILFSRTSLVDFFPIEDESFVELFESYFSAP